MERDGHSRARTAGISGQIRWVQPGKYSGFSRKDVNVKCSVTMSCHVMSCNVNCHIKCFPYFLYFKYFRTFLQQSYREEGHTEKNCCWEDRESHVDARGRSRGAE